jgi:hypothetical protein
MFEAAQRWRRRRTAGPARRVFRMADDSDNAVLGQRARGPGFLDELLEPTVRGVMSNMRGINKGNDDVDVEEECQGDSSRSALTVSSVTTARLSRRGRSGIPLRIADD